MEAINVCPHHGDFMSKNLEEAMDFLSYVAKARMYTPNEDTDMKVKFVAMARRLEELEIKRYAIKHQQVMPCSICQSFKHMVTECPTIPIVREMFKDQENVIGKFKPNYNASYAIHEVEAQEGESSQMREVKAVITLRSGKEVDLPTTKPEHETEREAEEEKKEEFKGKRPRNNMKKEDHDFTINKEPERTIIKENTRKNHMPPPFLQALHGKKGINNASEILEVLRQCKSPVKYKDLGCPTISVTIGGELVERALLDMGASVNLLPYSVYEQVGLGELKPTSITLSLADRFVKIPRGIIEDFLVQIEKFYYPVDFVVLDTDLSAKETNYVLIILGRPFLATSNAIINCRNGIMQLSFGNMTMELNIFYLSPEEVCMIDNLVEEYFDQKMLEEFNKSLGILMKGHLNPRIACYFYLLKGRKKFYLYSMGGNARSL
ncbi:hypothetical protein AAG906_030916 [Vitis piasezkii]